MTNKSLKCGVLYFWVCGIVCFIFKAQISEGFSEQCENSGNITVSRTTEKTGFHRDIITKLHWSINSVIDNNCSILFVQHIPQEMYVDLDELKAQDENRVVSLSQETTFDVEKPAQLAAQQILLIYPKQVKRHEQSGKVKISFTSHLPVHWRYQRPTLSSYYVNVSLPGPTVLGKCEGVYSKLFQQCLEQFGVFQYPCRADTLKVCQWFALNSKHVDTHDIQFTIPVGVQYHVVLVTTVTMVTTMVSSLFLLWLKPKQ